MAVLAALQRMMLLADLASVLMAALEANRDKLNASAIARGQSGRVELHINPKYQRLAVHVLVTDLGQCYAQDCPHQDPGSMAGGDSS